MGQLQHLTGAQILAHAFYLVSVVGFMIGIMYMAKVRTARLGNALAALAMLLAIVGQFIEIASMPEMTADGKVIEHVWTWMIIGILVGSGVGAWLAVKTKFTEMPELVGLLNGSGGLASACTGMVMFFTLNYALPLATQPVYDQAGVQTAAGSGTTVVNAIALALAVIVGALTFSGSVVAYGKLSEVWGSKIKLLGKNINQQIFLPHQQLLSLGVLLLALLLSALVIWVTSGWVSVFLMIVLLLVTLFHGIIFVLPIGGGDMPVVISLLNSFSGVAGSLAGFAIDSPVLIVSGSLVGAAGLILTQIMCKAMNRSLANVLFSKFSVTDGPGAGGGKYVGVRSTDTETAALMFADAQSLVIVPGYGMAVAQAQHAVCDLTKKLIARGCKVRFAIHPVAGRMPGHMNVLLAEAKVPYDLLIEMDDINKDFAETDVVLVIGANDVVNPAALHDQKSPIFGMPILHVWEARCVYTIKRSLSPGFAGIKNELFEKPNNEMIYGDAKVVIEQLVKAITEATK